jgi:hypothetical protein
MVWRKEVQVHRIFACPNYIDIRIVEEANKEWGFTGMYGEFKWDEKYKTWDRFRSLHQQNNLPWIVMGDLNEILFDSEKEGGRVRPQRFIKAFHDTLDDCQLSDVGYVGDMFTWHRGAMRERLERGVANIDWSQMHPDAAIVLCY